MYGVFRQWKNDGTWERIHDALRAKVRQAAGKKPTPTAAIVDSQSIRTAEGGEERGYDAGKKITGRKRHIAVDTLGLLLAIVVHPADWQDQHGAWLVMEKLDENFRRLKVIFGDAAYGRIPVPIRWKVHSVGCCKPYFDPSASKASLSCRSDGLSNARLPGLPGTEEIERTTRKSRLPVKPSHKSP